MPNEYTDWRGTPIEVGSIVVWPGRTGSSLWMNEGEVVDLLPDDNPDQVEQAERNPKWAEASWPEHLRFIAKVRRTRESHYAVRRVQPVTVYPLVGRLTVVRRALRGVAARGHAAKVAR